jgi:hypothetical protein
MPGDLRTPLVRALESDLVGPYSLDPASTESLPRPPLRRYLTGFLAPSDAPAPDPLEEDDEGEGDDDEDDVETGPSEPGSRQPKRLPCSIGLSVFLESAVRSVRVRASFADYQYEPRTGDEKATWRRVPRGPFENDLTLSELGRGVEIAPGVFVEAATATGFDEGTRALTIFLVNRRPVPGDKLDAACIFQVELAVLTGGLAPRPSTRDERSKELDERIADLQYRDHFEWAVGHGVSAEPIREGERVVGARTAWLPSFEVPRVDAVELRGVTRGMEELADLPDGEGARAALREIPKAYGVWIATQRAMPLTGKRAETRDTLAIWMDWARDRIAQGIELLAAGGDVLEAFRLANRAMAAAARRRDPRRYTDSAPSWRLFQLAFVLLSLGGVHDTESADRKIVDLIFFPTGGGKTEAYLGVIAFALALRRLRGRARPDGGLGVAILLRYTLRLLTLDQLGRAATLICALEELRRTRHSELGDTRFSVGLWVGRSATANTLEEVREQLASYRAGRGPSPCPLPKCPWCQTDLDSDGFETRGETVRVGCKNIECAFALANNPEGLPVLFVDEHIYDELPCFLVGTVDKFAMLPWRAPTAKLFGRVVARHDGRFLSAAEKAPKGSTKLPAGLRPPELIVQDELHLISGPLGTMVGLYETAIDALCSKDGVRPKILASTATVRRATEQVRALFARPEVQMFPPQGVDAQETFFSRVDRSSPGRLYLGVAAPSRALKVLLIRSYVALLGAAQKVYEASESKDDADAYMTLVGYFNALRELGGMRRLLEDEVQSQVGDDVTMRIPGGGGEHAWVARRRIRSSPLELTSRESTDKIAQAKKALEQPHTSPEHVDVALASNMISVGIDIERLGLMVVAGQPKTASEYIQASSRVGRAKDRPGLVVTVLNLFKARDRSHYERFVAFHDAFYRHVEATSVTPFSGPALERGLAGVLVAMARLRDPALLPPDGAAAITDHVDIARAGADAVAVRAASVEEWVSHSAEAAGRRHDEVQRIARSVVDAWTAAVAREGVARYSTLEKGTGVPLLHGALDGDPPAPRSVRAKFKVPTSMRDVEPSVHLWKVAGLEGDIDDGA